MPTIADAMGFQRWAAIDVRPSFIALFAVSFTVLSSRSCPVSVLSPLPLAQNIDSLYGGFDLEKGSCSLSTPLKLALFLLQVPFS